MNLIFNKLLALLIFPLVFFSCGSKDSGNSKLDEEVESITNVDPKEKVRFQRAKIVFFSLPSPMETSRILKKSGAVYNKRILNSPANKNGYQTSKEKAVGLGVFIADLSFANAFDQQQDCLDYFSVVRELSVDLALSNVFTAEFIEKIEANIENEDSVLKYLSESYWQANNDLKEDGRESFAALVAAGAWVEGLHIATSLINVSNPDPEFVNRVGDQKSSLKQLINYMDSFKDPKNLKELITDLEALQLLFDEIQVKHERKEKVVDEKGVATVGSKKTYVFPNDLLKRIVEKSHEIRNKHA
ncbi:MAG: hypothetical protein KDC83_00550 [Flavobacteriales bacterium]|nr:hypothetical protein [Flavobacteriales bacterium]